MSDCDACAYLKEAIERLDGDEFPECRFFVFFVTRENMTEETLKAYRLCEFPTLVWFEHGEEIKRWAGFFADESPLERFSKFLSIIEPLVSR